MNLFHRFREGARDGDSNLQIVPTEAPSLPVPSSEKKPLIGQIEAMEVAVTVGQGDDLVAKDRNIWRQRTSSDPYVVVSLVRESAATAKTASFSNKHQKEVEINWGRTHTEYKTRYPLWNETIHGALRGRQALLNHTAGNPAFLRLKIFDEDQFSTDDAMGTVEIPLPVIPSGLLEEGLQRHNENRDYATDITQWYEVPPTSAKGAKGRLLIRVQTKLTRLQVLVPGNAFSLNRQDQSHHKRKQPPPTISLEISWNGNAPLMPRLQTTAPFGSAAIYDAESSLSSQDAPSSTSGSAPTTVTPDISYRAAHGHPSFLSEMTTPTSNTTITVSSTQISSSPYPPPMPRRKRGLDLDVALIAISHEGHVIMPDTLYYGNVANSNRSVVLQQGMHDNTENDNSNSIHDVAMVLQLHRVPKHVLALYLVVMGPQGVLAEEMNQAVQIAVKDITLLDTAAPQDVQGEQRLCTFATTTACTTDATAMFLARISRLQSTTTPATSHSGKKKKIFVSQRWILTPMEEAHCTTNSFGSLIPLVKSYTRDLIPSIQINPFEQVAVLRPRQTIRLHDYSPMKNSLPERITFALSWDILSNASAGPAATATSIDLDISAICLDANLNVVDMVWWKQLHSKDYNIIHRGDERENDEAAKDEMIDLYLNNMTMLSQQCQTQYIGFMINSYGGQGLHEVDRASCHWFDPVSHVELATFALTKNTELIGATAYLVGFLVRVTESNLYPGCQVGDWTLSIVAQPTKGRTVKENVEDLQIHLRSRPPQPPMVVKSSDNEPHITINATMPVPVPLAKSGEDDSSRMESVTETSQSARS